MLKKTFLVVSILVLLVFWVQIFDAYLANHLYYLTWMAGKWAMVSSPSNWKILFAWIVFSLLPAFYIVYARKKSWKVIVGSLFLWLCLFWFSFTLTKGGLWSWFFVLIFNFLILFGLGVYMLVALTQVGDMVKEKLFDLKTEGMFDVILSLWVWLSVFLVINYILILLWIFHPIMTRWMMIWSWVLLWMYRQRLEWMWELLLDTIDFHDDPTWVKWVVAVLLVASIMYFYNWFLLADIAYSTAWDANHAYMFYPKMWALNYWYYRNEVSMAVSPQLRYSFIAFWFSLFSPFWWIAGISMDTIAVEMNFWSGIFVLIFWIGLISEIIKSIWMFSKEKKYRSVLFVALWRLLLLLRLTSGMWAFLVFIDNKTDLWVLALIILAIYSGVVAMRSINTRIADEAMSTNLQSNNWSLSSDSSTDSSHQHWEITSKQRNLLILSWSFYAIAWVAKATALFDVINFWLFLSWIRLGGLGVIWSVLLIIWGMSIISFRWIEWYISESMWKMISLLWAGWILWQGIHIYFQKTSRYLRYLGIWGVSFLSIYVLLKAPFQIARNAIYEIEMSPWTLIEKILFWSVDASSTKGWSNEEWENSKRISKSTIGNSFSFAQKDKSDLSPSHRVSDYLPLYAQVGWSVQKAASCTLSGQWFSSTDQLYTALKKAPWDTYNEDVWRYVWFGWKWNANDQKRRVTPFVNPWRGFLFSDGCSSFNPFNPAAKKAQLLCEREQEWRWFDEAQLSVLQQEFDSWSDMHTALWVLLAWTKESTDQKQLSATYVETLNEIQSYMQWNTVKVVNEAWNRTFYVPYRFLNPFNITFNWSLQNLSSYYTDIWPIWLILMIFNFVWLVYWILARNRVVTGLETVTIFGWILWFFIWWWILWYAIGIIIWSIMSFVVFVAALYGDEDEYMRRWSWIFLWLFWVFWFFQLFLNFMRIWSQWWQGAFMRYKSNTWIEKIYDEKLQQKQVINRSFWSDDVFNLQFPHYTAFIDSMNESKKEEWALIAGTYARYFVEDQTNIKYDQFLTRMREQTSDGDVCNSYLRLKDSNKKYIVIDPNIGTVVQWAWNQSLFHRFFAKVDPTTWTVVEDWVMSMLVKMIEAWYLRFHSSNNIWSVYAFNLPSATFWDISDERRVVERARMSVPRFWNPDQMVWTLAQVADQRVKDGGYIEDLAYMLGKSSSVDSNKLKQIASAQLTPELIATLSQDERMVLAQYLQLRGMSQQNPEQYKKWLTTMISKNIKSWSQIIVLEVM